MNIRFAIPRRDDGGWRDRLWAYCRTHWSDSLPSWPIVEGHHDQGPFNRSAAINQAAEGDWDVLVIIDGDVISDPHRVQQAAELAHKTGKLVLPYHRRRLLGIGATRKILRGYHGSWEPFPTVNEGLKHYSSIVCVPRPLWDEVGGFDERYEGWGGEDDAFHAACKILAGGFERIPGDVWHLWHEPSPHRDWNDPHYKSALALTQRYWQTKTPEAMRALVNENRDRDQVLLVCLTNGARDTLNATLASAEEMLDGPIGRRIIANDSGHPITVDGWEDIRIGKGSGYTRATAAALRLAAESGQPWVFFLEDDFTLNEPIDLRAMQKIMDRHPQLVQLSLKRQAWYDYEVDAGGIIEARPAEFKQRAGYVEQRWYWAQNPMLCRRSLLAQHPWPLVGGSERAYGDQLFAADPQHVAGIYGRIEDPPRCHHIGAERAGNRY